MKHRATVEETLRRAADGAEHERDERAVRQRTYLEALDEHGDPAVRASEEMWRIPPIPDLLIAETALHHQLGLVHIDGGFERIAELRPLTTRRLG